MGTSIANTGAGEVVGGATPSWDEERRLTSGTTQASDEPPVVVLGAGPAGLLAAHAVKLAGRDAVVWSAPGDDGAPKKSFISGAQFLHEPIPDLSSPEPDGVIHFEKLGDAAGYAWKVYGDRNAPCSWSKFEEGARSAWSLERLYDQLWERYSALIVPQPVDGGFIAGMLDNFPTIISTIPAPILCSNSAHSFPKRDMWIAEGPAPEAEACRHENVIIYDGRLGVGASHYRTSIIFGHGSAEYGSPPTIESARQGFKPLATNCDCLSEVIRAGRFGEWKPGVLVHDAFQKVWRGVFDNFEEDE